MLVTNNWIDKNCKQGTEREFGASVVPSSLVSVSLQGAAPPSFFVWSCDPPGDGASSARAV